MLNLNAKIYVAGHRGLAGSAIVRSLKTQGYNNIVFRTHAELELIDQQAVEAFFEEEKPEYVVLAAAKVGGILANTTYSAEFIYQNIAVQTNVIHQAWKHDVKRLLFLGSSCIYPRDCPQPIKEEYLLTGPLEETNRAYAVAKISGVEMCAAYNKQYGTQFLALMPTNMYGPGDNYDLNSSHVLPALIRKAHDAKTKNMPEMVVWGTGTPFREFLYSDDLGDACVLLLSNSWESISSVFPNSNLPLINVGYGEEIMIRELVTTVCAAVGYEGKITWDTTKPDGTPRKLLDSSRLKSMKFIPKTSMQAGIAQAVRDFMNIESTNPTSILNHKK